ncbi:MAG: membrane protein insertion efficiency factor YidD [Fuerstiella sp.]
MKWWRRVTRIPAGVVIGLVRGYQRLVSPMLGPSCRFYPTCSQYLILAVRKYGVIIGCLKGIWRICRCHPWHPGGHDLP